MKNPLIKTMLLSLDLKECYHGHAPKLKKRFKKKSKKINRNYNQSLAQNELNQFLNQEEDLEETLLKEEEYEDIYSWMDNITPPNFDDDDYYYENLRYEDFHYDQDDEDEERELIKKQTYELSELLGMEDFIPF